MQKQLRAVEQFHHIYGLNVSSQPNPNQEVSQLRFNLMKEENEEYLQAAQDGNIIEIADALGDMLYILCGTILEHGLQHKIEAVFDEIQRSNMSKLDDNGKPIYRADGKVMKGPNYFKPNLKKLFN